MISPLALRRPRREKEAGVSRVCVSGLRCVDGLRGAMVFGLSMVFDVLMVFDVWMVRVKGSSSGALELTFHGFLLPTSSKSIRPNGQEDPVGCRGGWRRRVDTSH